MEWTSRLRFGLAVASAAVALGCSPKPGFDSLGTIEIPGGTVWTGSTLAERASALEYGYASNALAAQDSVKTLREEPAPRQVALGRFFVMPTPVTNLQYSAFALTTGASEPWIDPGRWERQDTGYPYEVAQTVMWGREGPTKNQLQHPVVLVDAFSARAFCQWWGAQHGGRGDLPSEAQWERAARGDDQRTYPWGDAFETFHAATLEGGSDGPVAVGSSRGSSPFGVSDLSGNVFEWTRTTGGENSAIVKGGAWNAPAIEARIAARHARPPILRHVAVGFRCVLEPPPKRRRRARKKRGR